MTTLLEVFRDDAGPPEERAAFNAWIGATMDSIACDYCSDDAAGIDEDGASSSALADMPPDDGAGYVPPLLMAAKKAGIDMRKVDALLYSAGRLTDPGMVLVSVRRDGYTVSRQSGKRWRTICKDVKRADTAIGHMRDLVGQPSFVPYARAHSRSDWQAGGPWECKCIECKDARGAGWDRVMVSGGQSRFRKAH